MAYDLSTYTLKLTTNCCVQVVTRSGETVVESKSLTSQNVEVILDDDTGEFTIVGTIEQDGDYVSEINPNPNDVQMTTDGELINIGNSATIELEVFNCFMKRQPESGNVMFYEAEKDAASKNKAA